MRKRAAIIIEKNNQILLIFRYKNGREYFVIPGGGIKAGESALEAAIREIKEETALEVFDVRPFWQFNNQGKEEYYFYTDNFLGTPCFGGPELKKISEDNVYRLTWIPLNQLNDINLMPQALKPIILEKM